MNCYDQAIVTCKIGEPLFGSRGLYLTANFSSKPSERHLTDGGDDSKKKMSLNGLGYRERISRSLA